MLEATDTSTAASQPPPPPQPRPPAQPPAVESKPIDGTSSSITFGVMTDASGLLSKEVYVDVNGRPQIDATGCAMSSGTASRVTLAGLDELPGYLDNLTTANALTLGVAEQNPASIVTKSALPWHPGHIARSQDYFRWPETGAIALIDHDPHAHGPTVRDAEDLIKMLAKVDPQWSKVEYVVASSTTAQLYMDGKCFKESGGIHVYVRIEGRPDQIKLYFENLGKKLWLAGFGYIAISKSGSLLVRTILDLSVYDPSRLVFEGGAKILSSQITQRRPPAQYIPQGGKALDVGRLFITPREDADYRKRVADAKAKLKPQQQKCRAGYRAERTEQMLAQGYSKTEIAKILDASERNILLPGAWLLFDPWIDPDGTAHQATWYSVATILAHSEWADGKTLADPLEPDYGGGTNKAILRLSDGQLTVFSHAHGGRIFYLRHDFSSLTAALAAMSNQQCIEEWAYLAARTELSDTEKGKLAEQLKEKIGITKTTFKADLSGAEDQLGEEGHRSQHDIAVDFVESYLKVQYPDGVISTQGDLYVVHAGVWRKVDHDPLTTIVGEDYDHELCRRVSDYKAIVQHSLQILDVGNDFFHLDNLPIGVCTSVGFYRLADNGEYVIELPDPMQHRSMFMLPVAPAQTPTPLLDHWLNTSIVGEDAEAQRLLIQEITGAVLFGLMGRYKKATLLYGATDSGKSMFQRLLQALIPKSLQSTIKPSDWGKEQYAIKLSDKLLNIAGDIPAQKVIEGDAFKMVTGGDEFSGKEVYRKVQDLLRCYAAHIFSANVLPAVKADSVFFNRWLIVEFGASVPREQQIKDLEKRIVGEELPGLLWWAMVGAQRVVLKGGFTETATTRRLIEKWKINANSVLSFLADEDVVRLTGDEKDFVTPAQLYQRYTSWCRENNRHPFGKHAALDEFRGKLTEGRNAPSERVFRGIK
ncbi:MAG: hypothetical protein H6961_01440 [Chromatiaceae bacterium]|nr:hypothetical protein [Chromatiaceae bacterium]